MPSLWTPTNWPQRLSELLASTGELKEAPLRRDVRSLGMLLGEVLKEQSGEELYGAVEELRRTAIARREADATGDAATAAAHLQQSLGSVHGQADDLTRAYLVRAAEAARMPWRQANYNDFLYPTTQGNREMFTPEETRYRMEIQIAAARDAELRKLSNEVGHLLVPFERLMEPDVRARVANALAQNA